MACIRPEIKEKLAKDLAMEDIALTCSIPVFWAVAVQVEARSPHDVWQNGSMTHQG
jgi:hypothetical protein